MSQQQKNLLSGRALNATINLIDKDLNSFLDQRRVLALGIDTEFQQETDTLSANLQE